MKQLKKITLSNVRRFSEDVEIPINKGATIFLAPNGTGKTAIFEAIEFALTGSVKRLESNIDTLIRDQCFSSHVRLDFDSEKYCQAQINKGQKPILAGNQQELFGKIAPQNIPFLLKLTHILSQRGDGWFVQCQSTDAGEQLDHLSIGHEASKANNVIISTKRAASMVIDKAQSELEDAQVRMANWHEMTKKRDETLSQNLTRPLVPSAQLFSQILDVAEGLDVPNLVNNESLTSIKSQFGEVSAALERQEQNILKDLVALEKLDVIVASFPNTYEYLQRSSDAINTMQDRKLRLQNTIDTQHLYIEKHEGLLQQYLNLKNKLDELVKYNQEQIVTQSRLSKLKEDVEAYTKNLEEASAIFSEAKKLAELHKSFSIRKEALSNERFKLESNRALIVQWRNYLSEIKRLEYLAKNALIQDLNQSKENYLSLTRDHQEWENKLLEAKQAFNSVNTASDAIREAVGVIASQLSKESGECPVCIRSYSPSELHKRIHIALEAINPGLQSAASHLKEVQNRFDKITSELEKASAIFNASQQKFDENDTLIVTLETVIVRNILPKFANDETPEHAEQTLQSSLEANEVSQSKLLKEISETLPSPSEEQLAILENNQNLNRLQLSRATEELRLIHRRSSNLDEAIKTLAKEVGELTDTSNLDNEVPKLEGLISDFKSKITETRSLLVSSKKDLSDLDQDELRAINLRNQLDASLKEQRAKWRGMRLQGDPSETALRAFKLSQQKQLQKCNEKRSMLDSIHSELARWEYSEEFLKIEANIKSARGEMSEEAYEANLKKELEAKSKKAITLEQKNHTLNSFSGHLSKQLDAVHEIIRSINPLWNTLLQRVVIEPRFAETVLNSYSYYKKQHANINVQIHGQPVLASHVASEAQITDLQLTFLLALAQKYQWSPWRALLLDDPTQHHDLVHASSVFDLLRDYIAEHNFQVLLSTHDAVQARFFMRKLDNDGIPAQLYTLYATEGGVKVKLS